MHSTVGATRVTATRREAVMPLCGILEPWLSGAEGATTLAPEVRVNPQKGGV